MENIINPGDKVCIGTEVSEVIKVEERSGAAKQLQEVILNELAELKSRFWIGHLDENHFIGCYRY